MCAKNSKVWRIWVHRWATKKWKSHRDRCTFLKMVFGRLFRSRTSLFFPKIVARNVQENIWASGYLGYFDLGESQAPRIEIKNQWTNVFTKYLFHIVLNWYLVNPGNGWRQKHSGDHLVLKLTCWKLKMRPTTHLRVSKISLNLSSWRWTK